MRSVPSAGRSRNGFSVLVAATLFLAGGPPLFAPENLQAIKFRVQPGPKEMSAEEKALSPATVPGAEHGIVLLDETERDENASFLDRITRHVRAKILSAEARALANIEIPAVGRRGNLKKWWGWAIHPDGSVRELEEDALVEQEVVRSGRRKALVLKGALPGVEPGTVIDYGYTVERQAYTDWLRVDLQRKWPIREFRFRWIPWAKRGSSYLITRAAGLSVQAVTDSGSVLITGKNLPAAVEEPHMPPWGDSVAAVNLFYVDQTSDPAEFWKQRADWIDGWQTAFCKEKPIRDAIASMKIPEGADLDARLRAAYGWMAGRLKNTDRLTAEQQEAREEQVKGRKSKTRTSENVLSEWGGETWELKYLFACFAFALGADVDFVYATDRTENLFDPSLLTMRQFDWMLVFVRPPKAADEKGVFIENTMGLPYGEVPWWVTGASGWMANLQNPHVVRIRPSPAASNVSETKALVTFGAGDGSADVKWSRTGTGQNGLLERLAAREMDPSKQKKWLDDGCGMHGDYEITQALAPDLADLRKGLHLECAGRKLDTGFEPGLDGYSFPIAGPWIPSVPELTSATRIHPVVFPFPRVDKTILEVEAPPGFEPVPPAAPGTAESRYGKYVLSINSTGHGFRVERMFGLAAVGVPAREYDPLRRFLSEVHRLDASRLEFRRTGAGE